MPKAMRLADRGMPLRVKKRQGAGTLETKGTDRLYYKPRRRAGRHVRERREFAIARRLATSSGKETQEPQATAWGAVQSGVTDGVALPQTQQPKQQQQQQQQQ